MITPARQKERRAEAANTPRLDAERFAIPAVDIHETKDSYVIEAEMPGVTRAGLEVLLEGNELTLIGRRQPDLTGFNAAYRESRPHDYRRVFVVDPAIDTERISATIERGVLVVHLPKAEKVKPRRIPVNG